VHVSAVYERVFTVQSREPAGRFESVGYEGVGMSAAYAVLCLNAEYEGVCMHAVYDYGECPVCMNWSCIMPIEVGNAPSLTRNAVWEVFCMSAGYEGVCMKAWYEGV